MRQSPRQERPAFQVGEIDRQRGAATGIAVRRTETKHGRQWERHDVSQENGTALQDRGTAAIRRMVPPQSGQMAKSAAERAIALDVVVGRLADGTRDTGFEQPTTESEAVTAGAIGEETVVADTMEAVGQSV